MSSAIFRFLSAISLCFALTAPLVAQAAQTGEPVSWMSNEGVEIGALQVTGLTDPFVEYRIGEEPLRGFRYVTIDLAVTNTSNRAIDFNPVDLLMLDDSGFLTARDSVTPAEDSGLLELQSGSIAPGATSSGLVSFQMLSFAQPVAAFSVPEGGRLISLFDTGPAPPAIGVATAVIASTGGPLSEVTVNAIADPFTEFEAGAEPLTGSHYLLANVTVTNSGDRPLRVLPDNFGAVDADGFFLGAGSVPRLDQTLPDLASVSELPPGDSVSGAIVFQVFDYAQPANLLYSPADDRIIMVAALDGAGSKSIGALAAATAAAGTDCDAVEQWAVGLNGRIEQARLADGALPDPLESSTAADAAAIYAASDTYMTLAVEQEAASVPAAAAAMNTIMVDFFTVVAQDLSYFAEGLELDDPVQQFVALANLQLDEEYITGPEPAGEFALLGAACPVLLELTA